MERFIIKFSKNQKMPPGYTVEFWECDEMYHFVNADNPDDESSAYCNRFRARREAWREYNLKKQTTCQHQ